MNGMRATGSYSPSFWTRALLTLSHVEKTSRSPQNRADATHISESISPPT